MDTLLKPSIKHVVIVTEVVILNKVNRLHVLVEMGNDLSQQEMGVPNISIVVDAKVKDIWLNTTMQHVVIVQDGDILAQKP